MVESRRWNIERERETDRETETETETERDLARELAGELERRRGKSERETLGDRHRRFTQTLRK